MIDNIKLKELCNDYYYLSLIKLENNEYTDKEISFYTKLIQEHFYFDGVIECPYYDGKTITDRLLLIPRTRVINYEKWRGWFKLWI